MSYMYIVRVLCTDNYNTCRILSSRLFTGPVNRLLSWSGLVPLSRLTYMAYLIHPIVMLYFNYSLESPVLLNDINMVSVYKTGVY